MKIIKNLLFLVVALLISYFLTPLFGKFYAYLFPKNLGGALPTDTILALTGFPLSYIFFLTLLFTAFGGKHKHWWIGILLIPAAIVEFYFDPSHLYIPILLALVGWLLGDLISRLFTSVRKA